MSSVLQSRIWDQINIIYTEQCSPLSSSQNSSGYCEKVLICVQYRTISLCLSRATISRSLSLSHTISLSLDFSLSFSISLSNTHKHTYTHTHTQNCRIVLSLENISQPECHSIKMKRERKSDGLSDWGLPQYYIDFHHFYLNSKFASVKSNDYFPPRVLNQHWKCWVYGPIQTPEPC